MKSRKKSKTKKSSKKTKLGGSKKSRTSSLGRGRTRIAARVKTSTRSQQASALGSKSQRRRGKAPASSPPPGEGWLRKAFHLAAQKELDAGEYFSAACDFIQAIPGCTLLNLYVLDSTLSSDKSKQKRSVFSLLGFSHRNTSLLQRELGSFHLEQKEGRGFHWNEKQAFKPFPREEAPFALYGLEGEGEEVCVLKPEAGASVFYQPLWHQAKVLGAVSIAFSDKSYLNAKLLENLEACAFIFGYLLLEEKFGLSQKLLSQEQEQIEKSREETQRKLELWERRVLDGEERHRKKEKEWQERSYASLKESKSQLALLEEQERNVKAEFQRAQEELEKELEETKSAWEETSKKGERWHLELSQEKQSNEELSKKLLALGEENRSLIQGLEKGEEERKILQTVSEKNRTELESKVKETTQKIEEQRKELEKERRNKQLEFAQHYKELRNRLKERKKELKRGTEKNAELEKEMRYLRKELEKKVKEDKEERTRLLERLELAQKQKAENEAEAADKEQKLKLEIREIAELRKTEKKTYEDLKSSQKEEIAEQNQKIFNLNRSLENRENHLEKEKEKYQSLENEGKKTQEVIGELREKLEKQKERFQKQMAEQKNEMESELEEISEYKRKLDINEKEKQSIQNEKDALMERSHTLLAQLEDSEKKINSKDHEIDSYKNEILQLKEGGASLKNTIRQQSAELANSQKEKNSLEKEINSYRHRQLQLEKTLFSVNEEIHSKKSTISKEKQKREELKRFLESQELKLKSLIEENLHMRSAKKKWEWERLQFLENEKNRSAQFAPFVELLGEIANRSGLEGKLTYLYTKILKPKEVKRMFLYSLKSGQELQLESAYWQDHKIFSPKGGPIPLQKSIFGQALASLKTQFFQGDPNMVDADIPEDLKDLLLKQIKNDQDLEKGLAFILLVPLVVDAQSVGILSLASDTSQTFTEERIQLLSQLAPLLAVALQHQKNLDIHSKIQKHSQSLSQSNQYLQERYTHINGYMRQLRQELEKELPESIKASLNPKLRPPKALEPFLEEIPNTNEKQAPRFIKWVELLGEKARKSTGLDFYQELETETLHKLSSAVGAAFFHVYWLTCEAVDNVIAHSRASKMYIRLENENSKYSLAIIDNGDGLVRTSGNRKPLHDGRGLQAIYHLAMASGAQQVEFLNSDGNGKKGHGLSIVISWNRKELDSLERVE